MEKRCKMGWIMIFFGVVFGALSLWLIPQGYYILSHKNPPKTKSDIRIEENKELPKQQSIGIKIEGAKGVNLKDNIIEGFDTGIDAHNVEDISTENNKINK